MHMSPETSFLTPRIIIGNSEREGGGRRGVVKGTCEANKTGNSMIGGGVSTKEKMESHNKNLVHVPVHV